MEDKWKLLFGTMIITVSGVLLIVYSGSPSVKDAVAQNRLCQKLKELGSDEYTDCQTVLNTVVDQLLDSKEINLYECKGEKTTVNCPVRVWYVIRHLVITSPAIVQKVNQNITYSNVGAGNISNKNNEPESNPSPRHDNLVRCKREVLKKHNHEAFKKKDDPCGCQCPCYK